MRRSDYFNASRYGIPVNTLDSVHSISTFCCNPMWLQLPKMGIHPRNDEIKDYVALFRYIAHLLGTPTSHFANAAKAKATMESMYLNELNVTDTSKTVTYNFLRCIENLPRPLNVTCGFIEAGSRWINGHELCDELGLGRPNIVPYIKFDGHCVFLVGLAWAQRTIPRLDRWIINVSSDPPIFATYGFLD